MKENNKYKKKISCKNLTNLQSSLPIEALIILQFPFRVDFELKTVLNTVLLLQGFWLIKHFMWCPTTFMNKYIYTDIQNTNEWKLCWKLQIVYAL